MPKKSKRLKKYDPLLFKGIAHRGLHDDKRPENSLAAFRAAAESGCAMELDIHLAKGGSLVVCHDSDLKRVTGKEGKIEEMTLEEIRAGYKLADGSDLPTLEEVMALVDERAPIVIELKSYKGNGFRLARAMKKRFKFMRDKRKYTFISFDPRCLIPLPKRPFRRGLLLTLDYEWVIRFRDVFEYIDVEDKMVDDKRIRKYARKKPVNVWTITDERTLASILPKVDMVTFEKMPLKTVREAIEKNAE